ncbi:MAG TPA: hypothetical protein VGL61_09140 [Kofleriaceae bacterium]|jgi:hypothetical protein|nr:hypothetical protein [Polyangia bacterium]
MKLVGERRALASVIFALYALFYFVLAASAVQPELDRALYALCGVYGLAFFALVAGYFWARWYAVGVGLYGVIVGALGMWQVGPEPIILFIGGTHLAAAAMLWGEAMSASYDGQTKWRERFHMDDNAVHRLGRSVIRAGVSLPIVLLYALAPRAVSGASFMLAIPALLLVAVGFRALVKMKTWGVLALGTAGGLLLVSAALAHGGASLWPALSGALLASAALPFAAPMLRFVRG